MTILDEIRLELRTKGGGLKPDERAEAIAKVVEGKLAELEKRIVALEKARRPGP